jgi:hypothetical protein
LCPNLFKYVFWCRSIAAGFLSCGTWHCVAWEVIPEVSKERDASFFDPLLRSIGNHVSRNTVSHPRKPEPRLSTVEALKRAGCLCLCHSVKACVADNAGYFYTDVALRVAEQAGLLSLLSLRGCQHGFHKILNEWQTLNRSPFSTKCDCPL